MSMLKYALARMLKPTGGWKRHIATLAAGLVIAAGFAVAQTGKPDISSLPSEQVIAVEARQIESFDRADGARTRFGALEWRGGLVLTSDAKSFGGWSGLALAADGKSFIAVSDAGTWMKAELAVKAGRLAGVAKAHIGPLRSRDGKTLARGRDRDAESVVVERGTVDQGTLLVAFEQNDRIGRFPIGAKGLGAPLEYITMPDEARSMRMNGLETVALLEGGAAKGSIVGIAEQASRDGRHAGWIWVDGKPARFSIAGAGGFDVTDAKSLSDGSLILLERRFRWSEGVKMRISRVDAKGLKPGAVAPRELVLEADMGQEIDNMEGLALHTSSNGETILTLISDDNFNHFLQRTVLLQFALAPVSTAAKPAETATAKP